MKNTHRFFWVAGLLVVAMGLAHSQPQPENGAQQHATVSDFRFESGAVIHGFRIG